MAHDVAREIYQLAKVQEKICVHEKVFYVTLSTKDSSTMKLCIFKDPDNSAVKVSVIGCVHCNFQEVYPDILIYEERFADYDLTRIASKVILKGFLFGIVSGSFCCKQEQEQEQVQVQVHPPYIDIDVHNKINTHLYMKRIDSSALTYNDIRIENESFFVIAQSFADIFQLCIKSLHTYTPPPHRKKNETINQNSLSAS